MRNIMFLLLLHGLFGVGLVGCDRTPPKTESMLRLEALKRQQQEHVEKALSILDNDVGDNPLTNLAQLKYAREVTINAAAVFKNANVVGIKQPRLEMLEKRFADIRPLLANHSFELLRSVAQQTVDLRERLSEIKSQSYVTSNEQDINGLVEHLAEQYNKDIKQCCLNDLTFIDELLWQPNDDTYLSLRKYIGRVTTHQEQILREENRGGAYFNELEQLYLRLSEANAI